MFVFYSTTTAIDTSCKWHLERRKELNLLPLLHMELQDWLGWRKHDENTSKEKFLKEKIPRHALSLSDRECGKNNTPFPFWRERESRPLFTVSQLLSSKILFFFCWVKFQTNKFNSDKLPAVNPNQCILCLRSVRCVGDVQKKLSYWLPANPSCSPPSLSFSPVCTLSLLSQRGWVCLVLLRSPSLPQVSDQ